jgi:recombination protein RecA
LDIRLGGGWPANHWIEVIGNESSGKTAMILWTIAANMAIDPEWTVLWIASEQFNAEWAEQIGVDLSRIILLPGNVMETAYNTVLDMIDERAVDCVVIDSYPALVALAEEEGAMEDFTVGIGARLTGKFFRKSEKAQKRSLRAAEDADDDDRPFLGFFVNQWREKIGVLHGDPRTTPGGRAKNYHFFVRVEVKRDEWLSGETKADKVGQRMVFHTVKNKTYKPQQRAEADFYFEHSPRDGVAKGQFDTVRMICNLAVEAGIITQKGSWFSYGEGQLGHGFDATMQTIREDFDLYREIHHAVFEHYLPGIEPPDVAPPANVNDYVNDYADEIPEPDPEPAPAPKRRVVRRS